MLFTSDSRRKIIQETSLNERSLQVSDPDIPPPHVQRLVEVRWLGRTSYRSVWDMQRHLHASRGRNEVPDILLLTEHEHVYTIGKSGDAHHLLADHDELKSGGLELVDVDRGGDITYHGPGQLVGYPILNLRDYYLDLHRYLRDLEEMIIRTLGHFGINASRDNAFTGVWVGGDKIAAIGVKASSWITMHGFALNVDPDLTRFDRIIPCGIFHKGVTSIRKVTGSTLPMRDVQNAIVRSFGDVFDARMNE